MDGLKTDAFAGFTSGNISKDRGIYLYRGCQQSESIFSDFKTEEANLSHSKRCNLKLQAKLQEKIFDIQKEREFLQSILKSMIHGDSETQKSVAQINISRTTPYLSILKDNAPSLASSNAITAAIFWGERVWNSQENRELIKEVQRRQDMTLTVIKKRLTEANRNLVLLDDHDWKEISGALRHKFTPEQLKERYYAICSPNRKPVITKTVLEILKEIAEHHGCRNWESISAELKTEGFDFSPIQCFKFYQKRYGSSLDFKPWTAEEIATLKYWSDYYKSSGERDFLQKTAARLPGRTLSQITSRCSKIKAAKLGKWDESEDKLLRHAYDVHGPKWALVAESVPFRTRAQCRDRWVTSLDPSINRSKFEADEYVKIVELVKLHGKNWTFIAQQLNGRTDSQVTQKYKKLIKNIPGISGVSPDSQNDFALQYLKANDFPLKPSKKKRKLCNKFKKLVESDFAKENHINSNIETTN